MNWNDHSKLVGKHAILSPSGYSWLNYDNKEDAKEKLYSRYLSNYAQDIGTIVHEFACKRIQYRMPLRKRDQDAIIFYLLDKGIPKNVIDIEYFYENLFYYINDAIEYRMSPEVVLYYSDNCFGTTDAILYDKNNLRIHDLKTGKSPAHIEQLEIYAALFCLEYKKKPGDLNMELRIYQPGNLLTMNPEADDIVPIMDKIISSDKFLSKVEREGAIL